MIIEAPMLKVNKMSNTIGGKGKSIKPNTTSTSSGAAVWARGILDKAAATVARIQAM
jgi:hypothetical protein